MTVNWFQLQQAQVVSLPVNHQSLCENAKLYEPGQRYVDFVRNLPTDGPRLESLSFDSAVTQNTGCDITMQLRRNTVQWWILSLWDIQGVFFYYL